VKRKSFLLSTIFICFVGVYSSCRSNFDFLVSDYRFVREVGGVREYELQSNGLRVLLAEDHSIPVATVMMTYRVGSRNEPEGLRGATHVFEHVMFKGTEKYNKTRGTSIPQVLDRIGALMNASTWSDYTSYYEILSSDGLPLVLDIEADRMRGLLLEKSGLDSERRVVLSEFDHLENSPLVILDHAVQKEAFLKHPYRFPVIGLRTDIENVTVRDLRNFYDTYYWPNNAVLAVAGDFKEGDLLQKIINLYGKIPHSPKTIPEPHIPEPEQQGRRFVRVEKEDRINAVSMVYKSPRGQDPDTIVLDLISEILSRGKVSRLYRALVDEGLATEAGAEVANRYDPEFFEIQAILSEKAVHQEVEERILKVLDDVKAGGVTKDELEWAKNNIRAHAAYARDGSFAFVQMLSEFIGSGEWSYFEEYLSRIQNVLLADIKRVANQYFVFERLTAGYLVSKKTVPLVSIINSDNTFFPQTNGIDEHIKKSAGENAVMVVGQSASDLSFPRKRESMDPRLQHAGMTDGGTVDNASTLKNSDRISCRLTDRMRIEYINGIKIIRVKTGVRDVVTIAGSFAGGGTAYSENKMIPTLTVEMLDKGTQGRDQFEISRLLTNVGAEISFYYDEERAGFNVRCLKKDIALVMELLADELRNPLFDAKEFEKQKVRREVSIREQMSSAPEQAAIYFSRAVYSPVHPHYKISLEEELKELSNISVNDVRKFYKMNYGSQNMVFSAVGDVEFGEFKKIAEKYFGDWEMKNNPEQTDGKVAVNGEGIRKVISIPDKPKVDVILGHGLPLDRKSEDFLPVYLSNLVLGGPFSSRLVSTVRDEKGLTYAIQSKISGVEKGIQGDWRIHLILNPDNLEQGINETKKQIELFQKNGVTQTELDQIKQTVAGEFKVSLSTTGGFSAQILRSEELGLGVGYLDQFLDLINQVTLDQANQAIRKYLHPEALHVVIAGSVEGEIKREKIKPNVQIPMTKKNFNVSNP